MQTILIVDDQEIVRRVLKTMLDWCGFATIEAASGDEALHVFELHREQISGVLLDVVMPGLSGEATFLALRRFWADLPVVFMSGVDKDDLPDWQGLHAVGYVHKPFCLQELLKSIDNVLGSRVGAAGVRVRR